MINPFSQCTFIKSVAELDQLPKDIGHEVAFAGRSNAGKSSAINAITQCNRLAKTSKTPGRTQTINLFRIDDHHRLVDLPGYGYAKVPAAIKRRWENTLSLYLQNRTSLCIICLVMDIRHPLQVFDQHMIAWANQANLPTHILLTKCDKLSRGAALNTLNKVKQTLSDYPNTSVQNFSVISREGILEARKCLLNHLGIIHSNDAA